METKNKRGVIVGIFIFVALLIFIIGVLTLGGQHSLLKSSTSVKAVFDDVGGLTPGNNIWYAGVKVGTIREIAFDSSGKVIVSMSIEDKNKPYIKKDAMAKVGSDGLIGNKIIVLYGGSPAARQIEAGDVLNVQKALSTEDMMATLQENNRNLLSITSDFKTISGRLANGQGSIGKLLKDETLANNMEVALASIRQSAANAQRLTSGVADYTAKLQSKGTLANDLVTDTVIFSRLRAVSRQIDDLSRSASVVVENLKDASSGINKNLNNPNAPIGALLHDEETAKDLKQTIRNLQTSTQKLDENMEAIQHNFLLRGFFKKKAKDKEKEQKEASKSQ
ncbi:MAG TPA: MlaD family protein [Flavisolibacter sp.]|nr:MlaD family protein [Flavisolibacter sp.]